MLNWIKSKLRDEKITELEDENKKLHEVIKSYNDVIDIYKNANYAMIEGYSALEKRNNQSKALTMLILSYNGGEVTIGKDIVDAINIDLAEIDHSFNEDEGLYHIKLVTKEEEKESE